jgi:hypothetical protein
MSSPSVYELDGRTVTNPPIPPPSDVIGKMVFELSAQPKVDQKIIFTLVG